jgi:inner membrane protein
MLWVSHLLISGTATSLLLGTASPTIITIGAIAGLLPDIDVSTSVVGRAFPWVSNFFERRMPHRSCTHSLVATAIVSLSFYALVLLRGDRFLNLHSAVTIGYFFGWFADCFTRGGVEMFWPASSIRCVCPGNRNLRLRTGSKAEYFVLFALIVIALFTFNLNSSGGILTNFNRLIASESGVQQIFNEKGSTHLIKANIKGVRTSDRSIVKDKYLIIQSLESGFLVQSPDGKIYQASTNSDAQILISEITADIGKPAITNIEALTLDDEPIGQALAPFNRTGARVFISGSLSVEDFDTSTLPRDPYQFPYLKATSNSITLEAAPLEIVQTSLMEEFATGQLQIRIINVTQALTHSNSQA